MKLFWSIQPIQNGQLQVLTIDLLSNLQILKGNPERIELLMVKPRDIRRKVFDRKVNTQDRDMNVISLKDVVRVLDGQFKVKLWLIKV